MLTFPKKIFENSNRLRNAVQVQAKVPDKQKCLKRKFLFLTVQGLFGNIFLSHDQFSN